MTSNDRMTCAEVFERLDDYLDRELAADEIETVRRHLDACVACAREYAFESTVIAEVRRKLRRIDLPDELLANIGRLLSAESPIVKEDPRE